MNKPNTYIQALFGHLLDLYKVTTFKFKNPHSFTKFRIINSTRKAVQAKQLIEVGTYKGVMAARCAKKFQIVYTVELDKKIFQEASIFLRSKKNTKVIQGDGLEVLPKILSNPETRDTLIFLDGHFSGGVTACGEFVEPALKEIEVLREFKDKIKAVIIDDFRTFGVQEGVPPKSALLKSVETVFGEEDYEIGVYFDQLIVTAKSKPLEFMS